ncbi:hypothetical protein LR48_Vigan07g195100 [Vigna angularis]|uniref:Uncharacterized protein n=1 Tax=Phaseolus angularis TaxID=3914 RepID=A0A0L9V063_PHAAN|nr:hypothetical protein LR48_Vigan07g195100 [Vigna angularis]
MEDHAPTSTSNKEKQQLTVSFGWLGNISRPNSRDSCPTTTPFQQLCNSRFCHVITLRRGSSWSSGEDLHSPVKSSHQRWFLSQKQLTLQQLGSSEKPAATLERR